MATPIMTATRSEKSGNLMTPRGRLLYPALFKPRAMKGETDPKKAKFQATLLFPVGSDFKAIRAAVEEVVAEKMSPAVRKVTKFRLPFLKTSDQPRLVEYAEEFPDMLRFNAVTRPDVVTPKGDRTVTEDEEADEVYQGRWARVSCQAFFYDTSGNKGVSLGLQNVQLLLGPDGEPGEALAGGRVRGTSEFEAVGDDALAGMDV
jgi:hypothetical protein